MKLIALAVYVKNNPTDATKQVSATMGVKRNIIANANIIRVQIYD